MTERKSQDRAWKQQIIKEIRVMIMMTKTALGKPETDSNLTNIQSTKYNLSHSLNFQPHLGRQPLLLTTIMNEDVTPPNKGKNPI